MIDVDDFGVTETLKNGVTVKIRAIRPADKPGIVEAFGKLDPESVYTRFFRAKASLSDQDLKAATEVDSENVVALVVTIESRGKETIIGGGRYVAFDRPADQSGPTTRSYRHTSRSFVSSLSSFANPENEIGPLGRTKPRSTILSPSQAFCYTISAATNGASHKAGYRCSCAVCPLVPASQQRAGGSQTPRPAGGQVRQYKNK
ncbi:MAG: hypothetical protein GX616_14395 [Planctomycetes bacterium]|nr:hypothetical protein [Planctomycetota bacterium]